MWDLSCPDWCDRIRAGRSLMPALPLLDQAAASRAVGIFDRLRLPDVPGAPAMAEAAGAWMRDIVSALFGAWDGSERHIREAFVLVPKKNSKTTGGAAIMVTALLVNRRPRAEFLIVAPTQDVADLAYRQAVGMIEADPVLAALFHIQDHLKKITYRPTRAFLKVKSFDPKIVTGTKPAGVLLDELHVIAEAHDADRVIGQLRGGLVSQPEGFLITITTQSERTPSGVFLAELRKARAVRDGTLKAPILPVLYEFPDGVAWDDPANWHMVTPNDGRSVTVARLVPDYEAARAAGEAELRRWASQHLNVEIGVVLRSDAWAGAAYWEQQADPTITLEALLARSDVVTLGVDGGGLDDLLGLAVLGRDRDTRRWLIGIDPGNSHAVVDALAAAGFEQEQMAAVSQGWRLGGAIKLAERKLAEGTLCHAGQALMAWCVGNAKIEPKGNALLITKQASGFAKIDALMALFNAAELMARAPEPAPVSIYEDAEFMRIAFGGMSRDEDDDDEEDLRAGWRRVW